MGQVRMNSALAPMRMGFAAMLFGLLASCTTLDRARASQWQINGHVEQRGEWALGCNNLRICTAIARIGNNEPGDEPVLIRMTFLGNNPDVHRIAIVRGSKELEALPPAGAAELIARLLKPGGPETIETGSNAMFYRVPRSGFDQIYGALQKRTGMPAQQTKSTQVVMPLPAVRIENPAVPPLLAGVAKGCPDGHLGESFQAWRGIGGSLLWRVGCGNEGLNSVSFWAVSGPQGAPPEMVRFEDGDGPAQAFNSWFDASRGLVYMTHYFGHWQSFNEDCGIYRAYAWGAHGMQLVEKRMMPFCGTGLGPEDWITTYQATVLAGGHTQP